MINLSHYINRIGDFQLHPLGFFYIQDALDNGKTQRIHIWLPNGPTSMDNSHHQHSYDIESMVVTGRMRSNLFLFEEKNPASVTEYQVIYSGNKSKLGPTGRKGELVRVARFDTIAGATYNLNAGMIHQVNAIEKPLITLLNTIERNIPVLSYGTTEETPFERRMCTYSEEREIEHHLIAAFSI